MWLCFFTHFFVCSFTCFVQGFLCTIFSGFSLFILFLSLSIAMVADSSCFPFRILKISRIYSLNWLCYLARTPTRNMCVISFMAKYKQQTNAQNPLRHMANFDLNLILISLIRWLLCVFYRSPIKMLCIQFLRKNSNELTVLAAFSTSISGRWRK